MPPSHLDQFILFLLSGLVLAVLLAILGLWVWVIPRMWYREPLLSSIPIVPLGPARWGGRTVSAVILLYLASNLAAGIGYGAFNRFQGAPPPVDQSAAAKEPATADEPAAPSAAADDAADEQPAAAKPRHSSFTLMLLNAIGSLLVLILLPTVLRRSADVALPELGFSWKSWPRQIGVGVAAALLTTPAVYAIQALASQYWEVNDHDVQKMMAETMSPGMAAFALFSTVLLAPLVEESLFRGVLLGWLTRIFTTPPFVPSPSPVADDGSIRAEHEPPNAFNLTFESSTADAASALPVVSEADPGPTSIRPNVVCPRAIVATSLLFAGMHASQWPAPVGIFFLSIVIGVVYQRTGSLLTAMVMHGVFNGCGTLLLLQSLLAQEVLKGGAEAPEIAPRLQPAVDALAAWWSSLF